MPEWNLSEEEDENHDKKSIALNHYPLFLGIKSDPYAHSVIDRHPRSPPKYQEQAPLNFYREYLTLRSGAAISGNTAINGLIRCRKRTMRVAQGRNEQSVSKGQYHLDVWIWCCFQAKQAIVQASRQTNSLDLAQYVFLVSIRLPLLQRAGWLKLRLSKDRPRWPECVFDPIFGGACEPDHRCWSRTLLSTLRRCTVDLHPIGGL